MLPPTEQGFTGHRQMDALGIVHMKGRIYDPTLGRFLQADPFVQAPKNSQNYNRYSYVLNNPMSYTDPSGYFFSSLFKAINSMLGDLAPFVAAALMFIPGVGQWAAVSMWNAAAVGFVAGGISTGSLRGALVGAFSAAVFQQIGTHFSNASADNMLAAKHSIIDGDSLIKFGGNLLTGGQVADQILGHAFAGGVISTLIGGKFGHGFFSAGITKGIGGKYLPTGSELGQPEIAQGVIISAVIGGTSSVISGGKFANGASTAAYQYLFNEASQALKRKYAAKQAIFNVRNIYNANLEMGNRDAGLSLGSYIYQYEGETSYRYELKAKALAALGFDVNSAPLAGYSSPEINSWFRQNRKVTDWVLAISPDDAVNFVIADQRRVLSVYVWYSSSDTAFHYTRNSMSGSWSCRVIFGRGTC